MKLASFVGAVLAKVEDSEKLHKNLRRKKKSATQKNKWKAIVNSNLSFGRKRMCQKRKRRNPRKKVERENRKEKRKRKNC